MPLANHPPRRPPKVTPFRHFFLPSSPPTLKVDEFHRTTFQVIFDGCRQVTLRTDDVLRRQTGTKFLFRNSTSTSWSVQHFKTWLCVWGGGTRLLFNEGEHYTKTILHQLLIYTSMKHSLLQTFETSTCASIFRHPV